jgi:chromosome partitioning protein
VALTIAILSQKGGTGKTTMTRSLADIFGRLDINTLTVDADPQGNLSDYFDVDPAAEPTLGDVLTGRAKAVDAIHDGVIPANLGLAEAELMLSGKMGRELTLRNALREAKRRYEAILIDCPPTLGLLTLNSLVAANGVIIPVQTQYYALKGFAALVNVITQIRTKGLNPDLTILGLLPTFFDGRTLLARDMLQELRDLGDHHIFENMIKQTVRLGEAPLVGRPITAYATNSDAARTYRGLAREVIELG